LFGIDEIPSDNQIRNQLDPVPAGTVYPLMAELGDELYRGAATSTRSARSATRCCGR